jgi:hypothetical protein
MPRARRRGGRPDRDLRPDPGRERLPRRPRRGARVVGFVRAPQPLPRPDRPHRPLRGAGAAGLHARGRRGRPHERPVPGAGRAGGDPLPPGALPPGRAAHAPALAHGRGLERRKRLHPRRPRHVAPLGAGRPPARLPRRRPDGRRPGRGGARAALDTRPGGRDRAGDAHRAEPPAPPRRPLGGVQPRRHGVRWSVELRRPAGGGDARTARGPRRRGWHARRRRAVSDRALARPHGRDPDPGRAPGTRGVLPRHRDAGDAAGRPVRRPPARRAHAHLVVRHGPRLARAGGDPAGDLARPPRPPGRPGRPGGPGARGRGLRGRTAGGDGRREGAPAQRPARRRAVPAGRPDPRAPRGLRRHRRGVGRRRPGPDLRPGGGRRPPDDRPAPGRAPAAGGAARPAGRGAGGSARARGGGAVCGPRRCKTAWRATSRRALTLRPPVAGLAATPGRPGVRWRLAARPAADGLVAWRAVSMAVR